MSVSGGLEETEGSLCDIDIIGIYDLRQVTHVFQILLSNDG